jgi:hypothetical protein
MTGGLLGMGIMGTGAGQNNLTLDMPMAVLQVVAGFMYFQPAEMALWHCIVYTYCNHHNNNKKKNITKTPCLCLANLLRKKLLEKNPQSKAHFYR